MDGKDLKYKITLDPTTQLTKPKTDKEFGAITKNLKTVAEISINDFVKIVAPPYCWTWSGSLFNGRPTKKNWISQQVFAIDVDNKFEDKKITIEELLARLNEREIYPQLWYTTLSNSELIKKFRVVLFIDQPVTDIVQRDLIVDGLKYLIPEADTNCMNPNSYLLGGKEAHILNQEPISTIHLLNAMGAIVIDNDYGRTKKIPAGLLSNYSKNGSGLLFLYNTYRRSSPEPKSDYTNNTSTTSGVELQRIDFRITRQKVKILNEFMNGVKLTHNQLFGLATQLMCTMGGKRLMLETMNRYNQQGITNYSSDKFNFITYINKVKYKPIPVYAFSPYPEDVDIYDIVSATLNIRGQVEFIEDIQKVPLHEAEEIFKNEFSKSISTETTGAIYIYKLPTAIGKTEILTTINATIAAPTNQLKNEIKERMKVPVSVAPDGLMFNDDSLNRKLKLFYLIGLPNKSIALIYDVANTPYHFRYSKEDIDLANEYVRRNEELKNSNKTILTTHVRSLYNDYKSNLLIYDEDPITSFLSTKSVRLSDIQRLDNQTKIWDQSLYNLIEFLQNTQTGEVVENPRLISDEIIDELTDKIFVTEESTNVFDLFNCNYLIRDPFDLDLFTYITHRPFPNNKNVVILSATVPIGIYQKIYGERVKVIDITDVEQQGKIIQYTQRSCSRNGLGRYHSTISNLVGNKPVLTFKSFKDCFQNPIQEMHFGNCSGYDHLKGKDIAVVGTPHRNNSEYLLLSKVMGFEVSPNDLAMSVKKVEYNGFRFQFNCYDNETLRDIQFALIESDLIQAVGRARTLRTEATVELYSNFPLRLTTQFIW